MTSKIKTERKRDKPQKKWEDSEICAILDFCHQVGNFEKPTAQFFYKKMIAETKIDATWDILKWKMRYLKTSFQKAIEWKNSTGAGLLENEHGLSSVYAKILKICPHYERLKEIFGEKKCADSFIVYESSDFNPTIDDFGSQPSEIQPFCDIIEVDSYCENYRTDSPTAQTPPTPPPLPHPTPPTPPPLSPPPPPKTTTTVATPTSQATAVASLQTSSKKAACTFAAKLKKLAPKTAVAQLTELQNSRAVLSEKNLEFEKYKFDNEKDIQQRRLKIEEERSEREEKRMKLDKDKLDMEFEIEKWKIELEKEKFEKEVELKKLKMEADERVAKYEAELKYKNSKNLIF